MKPGLGAAAGVTLPQRAQRGAGVQAAAAHEVRTGHGGAAGDALGAVHQHAAPGLQAGGDELQGRGQVPKQVRLGDVLQVEVQAAAGLRGGVSRRGPVHHALHAPEMRVFEGSFS